MLWSDVPRRTAVWMVWMIAPPERRYDLLTLGETLMRLSPRANQRLDQARLFEIGVGGSELNVGCLLRPARGAALPGYRDCPKDSSAASSTARRDATGSTQAGYAGSPMRALG
jgi:hypothetical protein